MYGCENIIDISPLASLSNLNWLNLSGCWEIEDFSPLSSLTNLEILYLPDSSYIDDIHFLSSLTNLKALSLSGCENLEDISSLSTLTNLTMLELRGCDNIKDYSPLCYLSNLDFDDVGGLTLSDDILIEEILPKSSVVELHQDEQGRLHNEKGPAIACKEGLNLYYWHGVGIPKRWIIEKWSSVQEALSWPNIEQRRVACEMIGWANIIKELDAEVIDENPDPEIGTLLEIQLPDSELKDRFLKVRCGTGREFVIPVPPNMRTARGANAWTWGLKPYQYQPEIRT